MLKVPSAFVQEQGKSKTMSSLQFDQFSTVLQGSDRLNSSSVFGKKLVTFQRWTLGHQTTLRPHNQTENKCKILAKLSIYAL